MTYMERMRKRYGAGTAMYSYKMWNIWTGAVFMTRLTLMTPDEYIESQGMTGTWKWLEIHITIL